MTDSEPGGRSGARPEDTEPEGADATDVDAEPDPLGGIASEVRRRRSRDPDDAGDGDFFDAVDVDVDAVDPEVVWADLFDEAGGTAVDAGSADAGSVGAGDPDSPEHVVEKRSYCQRCPHFAEPPESTCEQGDAEIVEVVDFDRFRVRNCPMVAEYGGEDGPGSVPRSDSP